MYEQLDINPTEDIMMKNHLNSCEHVLMRPIDEMVTCGGPRCFKQEGF